MDITVNTNDILGKMIKRHQGAGKIEMVKMIKMITNLGLGESKNIVDTFLSNAIHYKNGKFVSLNNPY